MHSEFNETDPGNINSARKVEIVTRSMGESIPRIFHQIFLAGKHAIPEEIAEYRDNLTKENPDWEFRFYDSFSAKEFIQSYYGEGVLDIYERIKPGYYAARADLLRYLIMYEVGGFYLDVKSGSSRPFSEVIEANDIFLLGHWPKRNPDQKGYLIGRHPETLKLFERGEICNWFIGSVRGHPFMKAVLDHTISGIENYKPWRDGAGRIGTLRLTGPIAYTKAIAPIIDAHPHSLIEVEDRGLKYTIFDSTSDESVSDHSKKYGERHYGDLGYAIVSSDWHLDDAFFFLYRARRKLFRLFRRLTPPR